MKLPKSLKKMMKKLQKQNLIVKVALLAVFIYAVKYLLKQLNIAILDSQYLEGFMDKKTFVFFKMNGCPHCEKMQGEWNKFVRNNRSGVATKELEASANQALAEKYNVQGYPTLLLVNGDKVLATYDGERKAEAFESFVSNN
tara:strand:- start:6964 stop:7389 length:426 start_codon:yes stop_codon:yes gene_type:complete